MNQPAFENDLVKFSYPDGTGWELRKSDIILVGEYATQEGPGASDHFICVIDALGNRYDVSDEEGASSFLNQLSLTFQHEIEPQLIFSTDFKSCILYPEPLLGSPLFIPPQKRTTIVQHIKDFFFNRQHELKFSDEVEGLIRLKSDSEVSAALAVVT